MRQTIMNYNVNRPLGGKLETINALILLGKTLMGIFVFSVLFCAWWQLNQPSLFEALGEANKSFSWNLRPSFASITGTIQSTESSLIDAMAISPKTILLIFHLVGLTFGFGSALFLDLYLLRFLFLQKVQRNTFEMVQFGSGLVAIGLLMLWLTGLGFLILYWWVEPTNLDNPKIWSKLIIVALLSANGLVVHESLLAKIKSKIGGFLLERESKKTVCLFALVASLSCVSWIAALLLGIVKELNNVVEGGHLLAYYLGAIAITFIAISALLSYRPTHAKSARPALADELN